MAMHSPPVPAAIMIAPPIRTSLLNVFLPHQGLGLLNGFRPIHSAQIRNGKKP
jgi:hypothetical protein